MPEDINIKAVNVKNRLIFLVVFLLFSNTAGIVAQIKNDGQFKSSTIVLSVNAYSFSDLLSARNTRDKQQVYSLFNLIDWCATQHIKALDPTAYFFPTYPDVPSDEYLEHFRSYASQRGVAISGTGIRNNFAHPDPEVRKEGVERAKKWIVAASKIGAPVLRVFAGEIPKGYEDNWEVPANWMISCYRELLPLARQYGVKIGIQNHGDMLQTAEQCIYILEALDSPWAGLIVDTGNFKTEDPYKDIAKVVPYAVNWSTSAPTRSTARRSRPRSRSSSSTRACSR